MAKRIEVGQKIIFRARQDRKAAGYHHEVMCDGVTGVVVGLYRNGNTYAEVDLDNGYRGLCLEQLTLEVVSN
jgi:hypothetical protein